jgi:hypothetical protein
MAGEKKRGSSMEDGAFASRCEADAEPLMAMIEGKGARMEDGELRMEFG